jgi:hypothetical protein
MATVQEADVPSSNDRAISFSLHILSDPLTWKGRSLEPRSIPNDI